MVANSHQGSNSSLEVGIIGTRPTTFGGGLANIGSNLTLLSRNTQSSNRPLSASRLNSRPQSASNADMASSKLSGRRNSREEVPIMVVERKQDSYQKAVSEHQDTLRFNYGMKVSQF